MKVCFVTHQRPPTNQKSLKSLLHQVCHPNSAFIAFVTRFFRVKTRKEQDKELKTGCFQSKATNNVSMKTWSKTKYQTFRRQSTRLRSQLYKGFLFISNGRLSVDKKRIFVNGGCCCFFFVGSQPWYKPVFRHFSKK